MAWRTIADSEVDPESPVTTSLAIAWRDNPIAIAQGLSGATRVVYGALNLSNDLTQGDIANSAIGQGELKTTNGSVSVTGDGVKAESRKTLPGGAYGFYPRTSYSPDNAGSPTASAEVVHFTGTSSIGSDSYIYLIADDSGGSSGTVTSITANQTYVQASPPYDLGDGECGLFIEVDVLPNGKVGGLYVAPDPVWANNGPTNIRPDWTDPKTGRWYKFVRRPALTREDLFAGRCDLADYVAAQAEAPVEEIEVTAEFKRSDMDIVPHSWASPPQGTICLLDPVNTHDLLMLHEAGEDVADLIHKGYIRIGDEVQRKGPAGVTPVSFKWRNTK